MLPLWSDKTRVFIDSCSLVHEHFFLFFTKYLKPLLLHYNLKLIIPGKVYIEVRKLCYKENVKKHAIAVLKWINNLLEKNEFIQVFQDKNDPFPDQLFQVQFLKLQNKYKLILITQDRGLTKDIWSLQKRESVHSIIKSRVFAIGNKDGAPLFRSMKENEGIYVAKFAFAHSEKIWRVNHSQSSARIPSEGDSVVTSNGERLVLEKELSKGGEGTIFLVSKRRVCKIYKPEKLSKSKVDKLALMVTRRIDHSAICWPTALVKNENNDVVGYVMPRAEGLEIKKSLFIRAAFQKNFPDWNRIDLAELMLSILNAITYVHDFNIFLGDINARNILVKNKNTVFLVDTDSYQLEGYACPVGMPPFLAPELYGKPLDKTVRTEQSELFAIATLLFMLFLPGKSPYSHQGGGSPAENVKKQHFPYPVEEHKSDGVPEGPWRYIWSHLPLYLKKDFYAVFAENKRLSIRQWQESLRRYLNDLRKDYVSRELFPSDFKQLTKEQLEKIKNNSLKNT